MMSTIHIRELFTSSAPFLITTTPQNFKELSLPEPLRKTVSVKAKKEDFTGKAGETLMLEYVADGRMKYLYVIGLGDKNKITLREVRELLTQAVQTARRLKAGEVEVMDSESGLSLRDVAESVAIGTYSFDRFLGSEHKRKNPPLKDIYIIAKENAKNRSELDKGIKAAQAQLLARDLVNTPASHMHPETMVIHAREIEKKSEGKVAVEVLDREQCEKLGMGAYLGVAQGSDKPPYFLVLHYKGSGKKTLSLIGKTITFDSGGLSLKPWDGMIDMKSDMAGGAAVLGIFDYLASERPEISTFSDIYGLLPACENMPSGKAMKPGDIVTASNGKTIEVLNTDAEGRLALADALVYSEKKLKSDYIIDLATLTGACMVALGNDLAGLFTNDEGFEKAYRQYAMESSDAYWMLPLQKSYAKMMKSTIADLKNIGGGRYGGAITAALFLKEFVDKAKWMHIDIAGPAHSDKTGASGWGVISIIHFLEDQKAL